MCLTFEKAPVILLLGFSLTDIFVSIDADNGLQHIEGVVVDGVRGENGQWDFDDTFTVFTTDNELLLCHGYHCDAERQ